MVEGKRVSQRLQMWNRTFVNWRSCVKYKFPEKEKRNGGEKDGGREGGKESKSFSRRC